ncbi:hypothetical protein F4X73_10025 [Candidatus Poribacteria bacterium]|nr:hypothetical protein [Candidatus Poribacteria bacterium]
MSFKVFISLLLVGCVILFGFIFFIIGYNQHKEDSDEWEDEFLSRTDSPPPQIPRTEEIPDEIRHKFAAVTEIPEKSEIIAEFVQDGSLKSVEFSPTNPNLIVSRTYDKNFEDRVRLWDINDPDTPIAEFKSDSASFSPDGKMLAISDSRDYNTSVKLWDIAKEVFIGSLPTTKDNAVFSPDRKLLTVNTLGIELWDVSDPTQPVETVTLEGKNSGKEHTFSADGKLIATKEAISDTVNIWQIDGNQIIKKNSIINIVDKKYGRIEALQFSPDPQNPILAIADNDKNIRLCYPPDWQNYNTIPTKNVYDLAFTPDGKTIISGGINEIEIWSVENGKLIASIDGNTGWVKCVDVSADGNFIVAGGNDDVIRVWNITDYLPIKRKSIQDVVVPIYFLPTDVQPQADMPERIDKVLKDVQTFFADEMDRHGLARKTFNFKKNTNGTAKVFLFEGKTSYRYYNEDSSQILEEIEQRFELSNNLYFVILEKSIEKKSKNKETDDKEIDEKKSDEKEITAADVEKLIKGMQKSSKRMRELSLSLRGIMFREKGGHVIVKTPINRFATHTLAQKFGKQFGLHRDYRDPSYLMSDSRESKHLSKDSALWLDSSRFFNSEQVFFDKKTIIKKPSRFRDKLRFEIEDADGISQVRLLARSYSNNPPPGFQEEIDPTENQKEWRTLDKGYIVFLQDVLTLQGEKKAKVELDYPKYLDSLIELHVIDDDGNRVYLIEITEAPLTTILRGILN